MSFVEVNIVIDLDDNQEIGPIAQQLESLISSINDKQTDVNVIEIDNPITMNPIYYNKSGA